MWKSLTDGRVEDVFERVRSLAGERSAAIHIGTDSREVGGGTDFVTVIAVLSPGAGGRVFYSRSREARVFPLVHKLYREAELSIQVASTLNERVLQEIVVHVDANEDPRHRSSAVVQGLAGMVIGYGFRVRLKPDSWCATHVADYLVKDRHQRAA